MRFASRPAGAGVLASSSVPRLGAPGRPARSDRPPPPRRETLPPGVVMVPRATSSSIREAFTTNFRMFTAQGAEQVLGPIARSLGLVREPSPPNQPGGGAGRSRRSFVLPPAWGWGIWCIQSGA